MQDFVGKWDCVWTRPGWKFTCQMELREENNQLVGQMLWQAVKWSKDAAYYYEPKADKTAIEFVNGYYDANKTELTFKNRGFTRLCC
jgi:hypothetical protein